MYILSVFTANFRKVFVTLLSGLAQSARRQKIAHLLGAMQKRVSVVGFNKINPDGCVFVQRGTGGVKNRDAN